MVTVNWKGEMVFEAETPSGNRLVMDAYPEGGPTQGPTPVEALLSSLGACGAMDVVSILKKMRQDVSAYRVEVSGERVPQGTWPRPFLTLNIKHIVTGKDLDPAAVEKAVTLSDEKYCSVLATLRQSPKIETAWEIEEA